MSNISIVKKEIKQFANRENRDYILRIETSRVTLEIAEFEFENIVVNGILVRGIRVPVRNVFEAIDAFHCAPMKAIRTDGSYFWIMRSRYSEDGKIYSLGAGNSSEFTVITRDTKLED